MAYTYLVGWKTLNKWYYGVRYAKNCKPEELMITYFTSSALVKKYITIHGIPDIIDIRKVFVDSANARHWEHVVLRRMNASHDNKFLNRTNNKSIPTNKSGLLAKGTVVVNIDGAYKRITKDEYYTKEYKHANHGKSYNKNKVLCKDTDGNILYVDKSDDRYVSGIITPIAKNTVVVTDEFGNNSRISVDDPNWTSGRYKSAIFGKKKPDGFAKALSDRYANTVSVVDKQLNCFRVSVDDERLLSGEIITTRTKKGMLYNVITGETEITLDIRQSKWRQLDWIRLYKVKV